jgi:uncharacterized protein (DUF302 family)
MASYLCNIKLGTMNYYNAKIAKGKTIEEVRQTVESALGREGFGVLTEIDIRATMKKKLDKDYLPHVILGACNPVYADKVLSKEPRISTLLPCNVTIRQLETGEIEVATINPEAAMNTVGNAAIEEFGREVQAKLLSVLEAV